MGIWTRLERVQGWKRQERDSKKKEIASQDEVKKLVKVVVKIVCQKQLSMIPTVKKA